MNSLDQVRSRRTLEFVIPPYLLLDQQVKARNMLLRKSKMLRHTSNRLRIVRSCERRSASSLGMVTGTHEVQQDSKTNRFSTSRSVIEHKVVPCSD